MTSAEAAARLAADGPNALPVTERKRLATALGVVREPMFLLLVAAAVVYLVVGDIREALVLAASILVREQGGLVESRAMNRDGDRRAMCAWAHVPGSW